MGEHTLREVLKRRSEETIRKIQQRRYWRRRTSGAGSPMRSWLFIPLAIAVILIIGAGSFLYYVNHEVETLFSTYSIGRYDRVYGQPLEIYAGRRLSAGELTARLRATGFARGDGNKAGTYLARAERVTFTPRADDGQAHGVGVDFSGARISDVRDPASGAKLDVVRLPPELIGAFDPGDLTTRVLLAQGSFPAQFSAFVVGGVDADFFKRPAFQPSRLWAALSGTLDVKSGAPTLGERWVDLRADLGGPRLFQRIDRMLMGGFLRLHHTRTEVLEAFVNDVVLGHRGPDPVRGFAAASFFYFHQPLYALDTPRLALLVGLARQDGSVDPRQDPAAARAARAAALAALVDSGVINAAAAQAADAAPLGVVGTPPESRSPNDAYLDLVKREFQLEYGNSAKDVPGLRVSAGLDPVVQSVSQSLIAAALDSIEGRLGLPPGTLDAGVIVTRLEDSRVLAVIGSRDDGAPVDNALDTLRPVGSLLDPAIYLTALQSGDGYTLASPLDDSRLEIQLPDGTVWHPDARGHGARGTLSLAAAMAGGESYAAVRVGLDVGVGNVLRTLSVLGLSKPVDPQPDVLDGSLALSAFQVSQLYSTLAAGGQRIMLSAIDDVSNPDGADPKRNGLAPAQAVPQPAAYMIDRALQYGARAGRGASLYQGLDPDFHFAAQIGDTPGEHDAWFAGFSGDRLVVVWVGRADGKALRRSAAEVAVPVWRALMQRLAGQPFRPAKPPQVNELWMDAVTGKASAAGCPGAVQLPFLDGTRPPGPQGCH